MITQQPPAKAGGLAIRTESPDTGKDPSLGLSPEVIIRVRLKNVHMIFAHNALQYLDLERLARLANPLPNPQGHITREHSVPIFGYEVILNVVERMAQYRYFITVSVANESSVYSTTSPYSVMKSARLKAGVLTLRMDNK